MVTKTPSRDEQAEDWTLVHSLERSERFGGDWHPLSDIHTCRVKKKKKEKKLAHGRTSYSKVRNFSLKT